MSARQPSLFLQSLPNFISLARLLAVPAAVWLIVTDHFTAAFWLFVAAGVSDALDGYLARILRSRTLLGAYLDPLADKALLTSVYVSIGYVEEMPKWLVILVVFRDVLIVGGAILYQTLTQRLKMEPLFISKVNTTAQIALAALILAQLGLGFDSHGVDQLLIYAVAATTLLSGGAYVVRWGWRIAPSCEAALMAGEPIDRARQIRFWLLALLGFLLVLYLLRGMLLPFVAGMAVAYFLDPVCDWLQRLGCSRVWATTIVSICFILVLVLAILLILPTAAKPDRELRPAPAGLSRPAAEHGLARAAEAGRAAGHRKPGRSAQPGQRHGGRHRGLGRRRAGRAGDQRGGAGQSAVAALHHAGGRLLSAARLGSPRSARPIRCCPSAMPPRSAQQLR